MFEKSMPVESAKEGLRVAEAEIARLRGLQLIYLRQLEAAQTPSAEGHRSTVDWLAGWMDIERQTASSLVSLAKVPGSRSVRDMAAGMVSFDRAVAETRLAAAGASSQVVAASRGRDVGGVWRLAARHRRTTRTEEQQAFVDRYLVLQPNLDESSWRLHGQLSGLDGRVVEKALQQRGDELPTLDGTPLSQRNADALASICQDSLTGVSEYGTDRSEPLVTVFVDATLAAGCGGEAGVELEAGPPLGPEALSELLCNGRLDFVGLQDGQLLALGTSRAVIPPRLRRYILWRDGGCIIEGCTSRYRLQVHHLIPRSQGGTNEEANLATLCWYHHHVAIHGQGHRLDPDSPPQRRRLIPPIRAP